MGELEKNCIFDHSQDRLHLGNKRKMHFFFVFRSVCTIFAALIEKDNEEDRLENCVYGYAGVCGGDAAGAGGERV